MQICKDLQAFLVFVVVYKPTSHKSKDGRTTWTKNRVPWAFGYEKSSSGEYGTNDTLDEKGETPG